MKYLLIMQTNSKVWDALTPEEQNAVGDAHGGFIKTITDSGELVGTQALSGVSESVAVRWRDGAPAVTDGPFTEAKEYMAGYYIVDVESRERAIELAAMIPDVKVEGLGVEVREIIFSMGAST